MSHSYSPYLRYKENYSPTTNSNLLHNSHLDTIKRAPLNAEQIQIEDLEQKV